MLRILRPAIGIWLLLSPMTGCFHSSEHSPDIVFQYESRPQPPHVGPNTFRVKLTSKTGQAVQGARVALEGDMTHPGMQPVLGDAREVSPGNYEGSLNLNMRGDWVVLFHITLSSGQALEREAKFPDLQAT